MHVIEGTIVDGRFEVLSRIGEGGGGAVFLAKQAGLDRQVAIKLLSQSTVLDDSAIARFEREAFTLSQLKHKSIVSIYGYGMWDNTPYIAMEYVPGVSLQQQLADSKGLGVDRSIDIIRQIGEALLCAHKNGIVHRDIKPSNVILSDDGDVKLIDFGFAKLLPKDGVRMQQLTEAGVAVGSILYMSPEQCLGAPVDQRSDIYSLGCLFFQCLTGVPPFDGDHSVVVMYRHLNESVPALNVSSEDGAGICQYQSVVRRAMAKKADDRFSTIEDFLAALTNVEFESEYKHAPRPSESSASAKTVKPRAKLMAIALTLVAVALIGSVYFVTKLPAVENLQTAQAEAESLEDRILSLRTTREEQQRVALFERLVSLRQKIAKHPSATARDTDALYRTLMNAMGCFASLADRTEWILLASSLDAESLRRPAELDKVVITLSTFGRISLSERNFKWAESLFSRALEMSELPLIRNSPRIDRTGLILGLIDAKAGRGDLDGAANLLETAQPKAHQQGPGRTLDEKLTGRLCDTLQRLIREAHPAKERGDALARSKKVLARVEAQSPQNRIAILSLCNCVAEYENAVGNLKEGKIWLAKSKEMLPTIEAPGPRGAVNWLETIIATDNADGKRARACLIAAADNFEQAKVTGSARLSLRALAELADFDGDAKLASIYAKRAEAHPIAGVSKTDVAHQVVYSILLPIRILIAEKNFPAAKKLYRRVESIPDPALRSMVALGVYEEFSARQLHSGDIAGARKTCERLELLTRKGPGSWRLPSAWANYYGHIGKPDEASKYYRLALDQCTNDRYAGDIKFTLQQRLNIVDSRKPK